MRTMTKLRLLAVLTAPVVLLTFAVACDEGETTAPEETPVLASEWLGQANWDVAEVVTVTMAEVDSATYVFQPSQLTFEAGKPYIVRIVSPVANQAKHYFATEGATDLYKAVATRKIQTSDAEYKAPHFEAVEMKTGGTALEWYFVAVLPGTYDIVCTIPGHRELGMTATATITGGEGNELDLEIASNFNMALANDARKSSSDDVWNSRLDATVTISETPYGFIPTDLDLTNDVAYKLTIDNPDGHASKHYFTAVEFYKTIVTRKAEDSQAEIKPLYFSAIELLVGGATELFVVPTKTGTFQSICTLEGHAAAGMQGTVVVN